MNEDARKILDQETLDIARLALVSVIKILEGAGLTEEAADVEAAVYEDFD